MENLVAYQNYYDVNVTYQVEIRLRHLQSMHVQNVTPTLTC